jgi:hypothetical protein
VLTAQPQLADFNANQGLPWFLRITGVALHHLPGRSSTDSVKRTGFASGAGELDSGCGSVLCFSVSGHKNNNAD